MFIRVGNLLGYFCSLLNKWICNVYHLYEISNYVIQKSQVSLKQANCAVSAKKSIRVGFVGNLRVINH
jgi:hypothetical protein